MKSVAGNNELALAKLQRNAQSIAPKASGRLGNSKIDALVATVFLEASCPVKHVISLIK